jgi:hypothetical protein
MLDRDELLMTVRLGMQVVGGAMMARGLGDAPLWEAAAGLAVSITGLWLSRQARQRLKAAVPSDIEAAVKAALDAADRRRAGV